jgi:CHAT domain-containing protein/tetratricopeptide (TPR) repeat protein
MLSLLETSGAGNRSRQALVVAWPHLRRTTRRTAVLDVLLVAFVLIGGDVPAPALAALAGPAPTPRLDQSAAARRETAQALILDGQQKVAEGSFSSLHTAIESLERALSLACGLGDERLQAVALGQVGRAYDLLGNERQALACYGETVNLARRLGDRRAEAIMLNNIGLVYDALGERRTALEYYARARPVLHDIGDLRSEAATLVNTGLAFDNLGEPQRALGFYRDALALLREAGDRRGEAATLNNIGFVYDRLGAKQLALGYFGNALAAVGNTGDARLEAATLNNIGYVYEKTGEIERAVEYYNRSLPILRAVGDRRLEAVTLNNLGLVRLASGAAEQAHAIFAKALELRRAVGDRAGEAVTIADTGLAIEKLGRASEARARYRESIAISRDVEDAVTEASTLHRFGRLEASSGNLSEARVHLEGAISLVERLRSRLTSHDLRSSYLAFVHTYYETYVDVLMREHRNRPDSGLDSSALEVVERARARSLLDVLAEARADIRQGVTSELLAREQSLRAHLSAVAERKARANTTGADRDAQDRELARLLGEFQDVEAQIRLESPRYASLTQPRPLGAAQIQSLLDPDTLLLEYSLGETRSYVWAVTSTSVRSFELPPRERIERATREVYELLTARNRHVRFETAPQRMARVERADVDFVRAANQLAEMVLEPVSRLEPGKRLVVVGDGVLNYVPFAALPAPVSDGSPPHANPDGYRPLVVDREVVNLPSASTLALLREDVDRRKPASKTLAVVADPVFAQDDERVERRRGNERASSRSRGAAVWDDDSQSLVPLPGAPDDGGSFARLPFTRTEAERILALVPPAARRQALDFDASRSFVTGDDLGDYRYVHFATHGILNSKAPELSGLVLSLVDERGAPRDGFLWAHEVYNLRLSADMVVLSGCRTGLGKEIRGEGLVGLTRGFLYAGASRVLVSLWDVSDEASASLMARLYGEMLGGERRRPPAALRAAQLAVRSEERWRAPYYWAAFVLQGEVR